MTFILLVRDLLESDLEEPSLQAYDCSIKNAYIDNLDEIVDKYNKTYPRKIKVKPVDVKSGRYIDHGVEHNDRDPRFKVCHYVRKFL